MRIVCISDTHNANESIAVPDGDLLIHSGDATNHGAVAEVAAFLEWFGGLPHPRKIFVAGNHDWLFERDRNLARTMAEQAGITYLEDTSVTIDGFRIYGSPWQPRFYDWAFNLNRGAEMAEKWLQIPDDVEILITHGPPLGILDVVPRAYSTEHTGCEELRKRIAELPELRLHVFGHIHCGYGTIEENGVRFVNASTCDEDYVARQDPIIVDL